MMIRWAWAHGEWLALTNGGANFLHSQLIDSIIIYSKNILGL